MSRKPRVVIAGGTGFVGRRLAVRLRERFEVVVLSRREADRERDDGVVIRKCDLFSLLDVEQALAGADYAVYLVHSMVPTSRLTQANFADLDMVVADNFARACGDAGVKQIVYLGGLLPRGDAVSRHLRSRREVEVILASRGVPLTTIRAGLIVGAGGSSFEMLIRLVRRLPVMVCPKWTHTISQPVALKFLPAGLQADPDRIERFLGEVRIARQIAHPNVCRVYDIASTEDATFLSMEFVEGEDLSTLLRRFGRLPEEKSVEVARQICAGLGAAHAKGVIHRDLKPANVMLDSDGKVRLTDFGLAALTDVVTGAEARAGTPEYMAPEQLDGREVTAASDIYALGLVLYELFTGRRAYQAKNLAELKDARSSMPESPRSIIQTLDPVIERLIERCLDRDPSRRPESALAVAAVLAFGLAMVRG